MRLGRALIVAALTLTPSTAAPHAALLRSNPAARMTVSQSPPRVELWFSERLEPAYSSLSVWNESGVRVDGQDVIVGPEDSHRLSVSLAPLPTGTYVVRYRVLSVDGHVLEASFTFAVKSATSSS
jgi:methionine-rich copper-binding protein CopC